MSTGLTDSCGDSMMQQASQADFRLKGIHAYVEKRSQMSPATFFHEDQAGDGFS